MKDEIFKFMNDHPIFQLATCTDGIPHVRHMILFRADEDGIIFNTGLDKDVCTQIFRNCRVEMCFLDIDSFRQIRVEGSAAVIEDYALKREIVEHPTRYHLKMLEAFDDPHDFYERLVVFKAIGCRARIWTIEQNYDSMRRYNWEYIELN